MSYYTIQAVIISLLVILGIHYLITKVLFNEKKYKNKIKKKVVFKLPQEEEQVENPNSENPSFENSIPESPKPSKEIQETSKDLNDMKNDIMDFMNSNEIYGKE